MAISVHNRLERLDFLLGLEEFSNLQNYRDDIERTFKALGLESGQKYLSIGIGRNRLPPLFALYGGLDVVGVDTDQRRIEYHKRVSSKFKDVLEESSGSLKALNLNVDENLMKWYVGMFDVVECVNFTRNCDPTELAQILLSLGKKESGYLVSLFGGVDGRKNTLAQAVIAESGRLNKKQEVIADDLLVSDKYTNSRAALIRVYR